MFVVSKLDLLVRRDGHVSVETSQFIRQLIEPDPKTRLTAPIALETLLIILSRRWAVLTVEYE